MIERAVLFADGSTIQSGDLADEVRGARTSAVPASSPSDTDGRASRPSDPRLFEPRTEGADGHGDDGRDAVPSSADGLKEVVKAAMSKLEHDLIERALKQTQGNVTHAARLLKISRKGLQLKMKELGLREREPD